MAKLVANSGDPDQMPRSAGSDLGLHSLPVTLLQVSRLQWVKNVLCKDVCLLKKQKKKKNDFPWAPVIVVLVR